MSENGQPALVSAAAPTTSGGGLDGLLLRAVLETADAQLVIVLDQDLRIQQISAGTSALLGWAPAQVRGMAFRELLISEGDGCVPDRLAAAAPPLAPLPETTQPRLVGRARLRTRDGFARTARLTSSTVHDEAGSVMATVVIATDTSMSSTFERRLAASEEQFRLTFEKSPTAMAVVSLAPATLGRVRRANAAFEAFTGRRLRELFSMSVRQLLHPDEVPAHLAYLHLAAETGECEPAGIERRFVHADGSVRWARKTTAVVTPSGSGGGVEACLLVQLADTTAQREATKALAHAALHDPLTGLANRALFADRLQLALTTDQRARCGVSLLYLDLDAFKPINDRYGHAAGDAVLVEVARRLGQVMRGGDTVARLGGDEFAVVCPGLDSAHLPVVLARVRRALQAPICLPSLETEPAGGVSPLTREETLVEVGVSIGTATSTSSASDRAVGVLHAPSSQAMVAAADQSMYAVKQASCRP